MHSPLLLGSFWLLSYMFVPLGNFMLVKSHTCDPLHLALSTNRIISKSAMMHVYQNVLSTADQHAVFHVSVHKYLAVGLFLLLLL